MHQWNDSEKKRGGTEPMDLEQRLTAYYGPRLREQPLSSASWEHLRAQLGRQRSPTRWHGWRLRPRLRRWRRSTPRHIQDAFVHVMKEAHVAYPPSWLYCTFKRHVRVPRVRISPLERHKIRLVLPSKEGWLLSQTELDVLVATGLARCLFMRKPGHMLMRMLLALAILLSSVVALLFSPRYPLVITLPIAIILCALWLGHREWRKLAFRADGLIVQWLGREHVCQGLHALGDRSRSPRRKGWGEPSLAERIERVCGTRVAAKEERLTLVG